VYCMIVCAFVLYSVFHDCPCCTVHCYCFNCFIIICYCPIFVILIWLCIPGIPIPHKQLHSKTSINILHHNTSTYFQRPTATIVWSWDIRNQFL
jgi:hypothetical protein